MHNDCISKASRKAVREAWKQERELVAKTGYGTVDWSPEQVKELLLTGKVKGYEGHHINSVKHILNNNPFQEALKQIADPDNVKFVTRSDHLKLHFGNFRNETTGTLLIRSII